MLGSGHISDTRFVLGKIILETMRSGSGVLGDKDGSEVEKCHLKTEDTKGFGQLVAKKDKRKVLSAPNLEHRPEKLKKQKLTENTGIAEQKKGLVEIFKYKETDGEHQKPVKLGQEVDLSTKNSMPVDNSSNREQLINDIDRKQIVSASKSSKDHARHLKLNKHCVSSQSTVSKNNKVVANNHNITTSVTTDESVDKVVNKKGRQQPQKSKKGLSPLSSLLKKNRK